MVIGEAEDHVESKDPYSLHNRRYPDSPLHQNEKGEGNIPLPRSIDEDEEVRTPSAAFRRWLRSTRQNGTGGRTVLWKQPIR